VTWDGKLTGWPLGWLTIASSSHMKKRYWKKIALTSAPFPDPEKHKK
jgi:hypothetical protein